MSELWSIPLVRISAAVGAAAAAITLLTPLWDRHLQTAGRRRVWCLLVLALLIAPWLHLPIPAAPAAAPSQAAAEEAVAVQVLPDTGPGGSYAAVGACSRRGSVSRRPGDSGGAFLPHLTKSCGSGAVSWRA